MLIRRMIKETNNGLKRRKLKSGSSVRKWKGLKFGGFIEVKDVLWGGLRV